MGDGAGKGILAKKSLEWGFYLAFQQVGYHTLLFFLEREQPAFFRIRNFIVHREEKAYLAPRETIG